MPQVPLPRVSDSAPGTPAFRTPSIEPVSDYGAAQQIQQQGRGMLSAGRAVAGLAAHLNEEHSVAVAKAGLNKWSEVADQTEVEYRSLLGAAASEIEPGVQGKQAGEASGRRVEDLQASMSAIERDMPSELSRRLFREHAERALVGYRGRMFAHEAKQIQVHGRAEDVATAGRFGRGYQLTGDPAALTNSLTAWGEVADRDGLTGEVRAAFLLAQESKMREDYITSVLSDPNQGAKDADAELRKIGQGNIDPVTRHTLRAKIDRVLKAERIDRMGVDIVANDGYRTKEERVAAVRRNLPADVQSQLTKNLVLQVARKNLGATNEQVELLDKTGGWRELLSDPRVIREMSEGARTLDQEIILARYPGQPPAGSGTLRRSLDALQKAYEAGEIDASGLLQAQAVVTGQVKMRAAARAEDAADALRETQQILEQSRAAGVSVTVDSPVFHVKHPELVDRLREHGLMVEARRMGDTTYQRATDPGKLDDMYRRDAVGQLGSMTKPQLYVTYYPHMDQRAWAETERRWAAAQPEPGKAGIKSGPAQKWDVQLRVWAGGIGRLSGADEKNIPLPGKGDTEQQNWWIDLMHDLNEAVEASGKEWTEKDVLDWAARHEMQKVTLETPGVLWGTNYEERTRRDLMAEVRRLAISDPEAAQKLARRARDDVSVQVGGRWISTAGGGTIAEGTPDDPIPLPAALYIRDQWHRRNGRYPTIQEQVEQWQEVRHLFVPPKTPPPMSTLDIRGSGI